MRSVGMIENPEMNYRNALMNNPSLVGVFPIDEATVNIVLHACDDSCNCECESGTGCDSYLG